jgi:pyruvate-formate lyase-activating enzyme
LAVRQQRRGPDEQLSLPGVAGPRPQPHVLPVDRISLRTSRRLTRYVDSNRDAPRAVWDDLMPVMNKAMIVLKALDRDLHTRLTDRPNDRVLESIRHLSACDRRFDHRVVVQDPEWSARVDAYRHGRVWTVPKQRIRFRTHQVHSGRIKRGG